MASCSEKHGCVQVWCYVKYWRQKSWCCVIITKQNNVFGLHLFAEEQLLVFCQCSIDEVVSLLKTCLSPFWVVYSSNCEDFLYLLDSSQSPAQQLILVPRQRATEWDLGELGLPGTSGHHLVPLSTQRTAQTLCPKALEGCDLPGLAFSWNEEPSIQSLWWGRVSSQIVDQKFSVVVLSNFSLKSSCRKCE